MYGKSSESKIIGTCDEDGERKNSIIGIYYMNYMRKIKRILGIK